MSDFAFELDEHWRRFLSDKVASGEFGSLQEAIEQALKSIETDRDRLGRLAVLLRQGEDSGDAVPFDYQAFLAEARRRRDEREAA